MKAIRLATAEEIAQTALFRLLQDILALRG
jgi:hypothetical protein